MTFLFWPLLIIFLLLSLLLTAVILAQEPKQSGLGDALGGGGGADFSTASGGTAGGLHRTTIALWASSGACWRWRWLWCHGFDTFFSLLPNRGAGRGFSFGLARGGIRPVLDLNAGQPQSRAP